MVNEEPLFTYWRSKIFFTFLLNENFKKFSLIFKSKFLLKWGFFCQNQIAFGLHILYSYPKFYSLNQIEYIFLISQFTIGDRYMLNERAVCRSKASQLLRSAVKFDLLSFRKKLDQMLPDGVEMKVSVMYKSCLLYFYKLKNWKSYNYFFSGWVFGRSGFHRWRYCIRQDYSLSQCGRNAWRWI